MYQWVRPEIAVPTHGERRHLIEHAAFAKDLQVPHAISPRNGDMVRLAPGIRRSSTRFRPADCMSTAAS
jgi:ribonuclease J